MQIFKVTGKFVTIREGELKLSPEQFFNRRHSVTPMRKHDHYRVIKPTSFKRDEIFGYHGPDLGKNAEIQLEKKPAGTEPGLDREQPEPTPVAEETAAKIEEILDDESEDGDDPEDPENTPDENSEPPAGNPAVEMSVADLKDALDLPTIKATIELLAEHGLKVTRGADMVPADVVGQLFPASADDENGEAAVIDPLFPAEAE